jgi:hypothetical protein
MKSGAFGKPEAGFASLPRCGKRQLSLEAPSRTSRRAVPREAPNTTKPLRAAMLRWEVSVAGPVAGNAASAVASAASRPARQTGQSLPGSNANTVCNGRVIRYNSRMYAPAKPKPLPNWSFNRTTNGMAPWPRGSVVHHLPRGQGAMPLSAG